MAELDGPTLLGIDIGGTRSRARLCTGGQVTAESQGPSASLPAAGLTDGVAVICGTGSVAVGSHDGRTVQAGGWGFLLGDEGGGYWVVREALRHLLDRRDHGAPPGPLGGQLLAATGAVAALAAAAIKELDPPESLPVVLASGLLGHPAFRYAARRAVAQALPQAEVTVLADEPVADAIRLARQAVRSS
jgi:N-acetylglucosamine kinase-like BadF-type ATPase